MNRLAPVIIFTYNRFHEIVAAISALKENHLADQTEVYVFSDREKSLEDREKVTKVREYLDSIDCGFKSFTVIKRKENYGLARNIIEGVTEVIDNQKKTIVLEDDLITSHNFLSYMNQALDFYQENSDVFAVSGYTGVLSGLCEYKKDVYFSYRPSSWGWATWDDRWKNIDWDVNDFDVFIKDRKKVKKFNRGGIDMTRMLKHYMQGKNNSWAIRWSYAMYKQDKYCVYPTISKIQNIGFGEAATNCTGIDIYQTSLDTSKKLKFTFEKDIIIDRQLVKEFRYQFSYIRKLLKILKF